MVPLFGSALWGGSREGEDDRSCDDGPGVKDLGWRRLTPNLTFESLGGWSPQ